MESLPPGSEVSAEVFVVMGGRAGAAALAEAADAAGQFDPGLARAVSGLGEPGAHDPGLR